MIKKFNTFINESVELKTEYQILHLNREERMEYFKQRFEYVKDYGGYFHDYEYSLLPKLIRQEYNQICVDRYAKIDKDQFDDFSKEMKIEFIDKMIYKGHTDEYFDYLSDDLKYYLIDKTINSNYGERLSFEQFKWCNEELRDRYIDMRLKHLLFVEDDIFSICSKKQKDKIVNCLIGNQRYLSDIQFKHLPPIRRYKYIEAKIKKYIPLEKIDEYQRKWYLAYKRKHNL